MPVAQQSVNHQLVDHQFQFVVGFVVQHWVMVVLQDEIPPLLLQFFYQETFPEHANLLGLALLHQVHCQKCGLFRHQM